MNRDPLPAHALHIVLRRPRLGQSQPTHGVVYVVAAVWLYDAHAILCSTLVTSSSSSSLSMAA